MKGATAADTHSAILDLIRSGGIVSRIDLADQSGLTGASISRIVKQLLTDGLIAEVGVGESTGGKRRTLLQLNSAARHAIGITLDFASINYLISDLNGSVVARLDRDGIGHDSPAKVTQRIASEVDELITSSGVNKDTLIGIGVAVPGRQDQGDRVLRSNPNATDWELFDLRDTLSRSTGIDVVVDNDSTCSAIGEFWVGRIASTTDFATVYMATGIGLGLIINGAAYRGASSNVGEIAHLTLDVNGPPCWCGSRGCLEMLAGPARVVELAVATPGLAESLGLQGTAATVRRDAALVGTAAAQGHPDALPVIEKSAELLAHALVSITNLLDLDHIVLAGPGFGAAGRIYADRANQELAAHSFLRQIHPTQVMLSKSSELSATLGAAAMVMHERLTPHHGSQRLR